ncbi:MAG: nucleotidyl transferase AbiEii/AbiGii toxin family protein [Janthinobacterium lividum]
MTRILAYCDRMVAEQGRAPSPERTLAQLQSYARLHGQLFEDVLLRYVEEGLIAAIAASPYRSRFPLHGAWSLAAWMGGLPRPTQGIDLLDVGGMPSEDATETLRSALGDHQGSLRLHWSQMRQRHQPRHRSDLRSILLPVSVGSARLHVAIYVRAARDPAGGTELWPLQAAFPAGNLPWVECCRPEEMVAEKAMLLVTYGADHSRVKDILDLWLIARRFTFDGASVLRSVHRIIKDSDAARMILRNDGYWEAAFSETRLRGELARRWAYLVETVPRELRPSSGSAALADVDRFLRPVLELVRQGDELTSSWHGPSGWVDNDRAAPRSILEL